MLCPDGLAENTSARHPTLLVRGTPMLHRSPNSFPKSDRHDMLYGRGKTWVSLSPRYTDDVPTSLLCHEIQHFHTRVWTTHHPRHAATHTPSTSGVAHTRGPVPCMCRLSRSVHLSSARLDAAQARRALPRDPTLLHPRLDGASPATCILTHSITVESRVHSGAETLSSWNTLHTICHHCVPRVSLY